MRGLVLDTSVAIAWYLPEDFSDAARVWQSRLLDNEVQFVVPSLHFWEFANVLRNYVRKGELAEDLAEDIFATHLNAPFEVAEPPPSLVFRTALEFEATAYDAVYIALARSRDIALVTAERPTTPWVVKLGGRAENVSTT